MLRDVTYGESFWAAYLNMSRMSLMKVVALNNDYVKASRGLSFHVVSNSRTLVEKNSARRPVPSLLLPGFSGSCVYFLRLRDLEYLEG